MDKNENIHIKLEISRDPNTGALNLMTRFDPSAPNFIKDENGFSWSPTARRSTRPTRARLVISLSSGVVPNDDSHSLHESLAIKANDWLGRVC